MNRAALLAAAALTCATGAPAQELDLGDVRRFLSESCVRCHGPEEQKADHDFTRLGDPRARGADDAVWELIAEQLSLDEMPPRKEPRPDAARARAVVSWICGALADAHASGASSRARLRRLNAFEYRSTLRDLLRIDVSIFDPTADFPPDEESHGFDNVGEALVSSGLLLDRQLEAASRALDRALVDGPRPEIAERRFEAPFMQWGGGLLAEVARTFEQPWEDLYTRPMGLYGYLVPDALEDGVPAAGEYVIRVRAQAVGREHPYASLYTSPATPLSMALVAADRRDGHLRGKSPSEVVVAEWELADGEAREYECRVWLEAGYVPRVTYPNGPEVMPQLAFLNLRAEHHPELVERHAGRAWTDEIERLYTEAGDFLEVYRGPRVRVHSIELEGPFHERWPPASAVTLLGQDDATPPAELLARFARRAWRRPVERAELEPILALVERLAERGEPRREQLRTGFQAILCAPDFLYLVEPEGRLDAHALAARLSYFLWSSMPDAELFERADAGDLLEPEVLRAQALRLLRDPKARAFVQHFSDRWLGLHRLGEMPPDPERYKVYYRDRLEESLAEESHAFFAHLLAEDLDVGLFLDAPFTFADATLARFYGIRGVEGGAPQRVKVPDPRRGGLLGQAGVLTVTANGIDTSPVIRGVWVLENLLGRPPQPPPAGVAALEPDTRGATSVREQLAKHRKVESCNRCHVEIDPMGFPLENYDAIGGWRKEYEASGRVVDASAVTPEGDELRHVGDLKRYLVEHKDQFAACLTEKLLTYATGAPIDPVDREEVVGIVAQLAERGWGLRTLVLLVVESELFGRK